MKLENFSICEAISSENYELAVREILRHFGIDLPGATVSFKIVRDRDDDLSCARIWAGDYTYEWSEYGWFYPAIPLDAAPDSRSVARIHATFWIRS